MATHNKFKITLGISRSDDVPIFYKKDGSRFDRETTLKLCVNVEYNFALTIKPSVPLQGVSIQGIGLTLTDNSTQDKTPGGSRYEFAYQTSKSEKTKNRKRSQLMLQLQFQDGLSCAIPLQAKFYTADEQAHLSWGKQLTIMELDCQVKAGNTHVDIVEEKII